MIKLKNLEKIDGTMHFDNAHESKLVKNIIAIYNKEDICFNISSFFNKE